MTPAPEVLSYRRTFPLAIRFLVALVGIIALVLPATELWPGVWPFSWGSLFVGMIILGAAAVGGLAIMAAFRGRTEQLDISEHGVRQTCSGWPHRPVQRVFPQHDVVGIKVRREFSTDDPDSYYVELLAADGSRLRTQDFSLREVAYEERGRIAAKLGFDEAAPSGR